MKEEDIYFRDLSNFNDTELADTFTDMENSFSASVTEMFVMLNLKKIFLNSIVKEHIGNLLFNNKFKVSALVLLGIDRGVRRLILQTIDYPIYFAEDKEDGVDWLLNQ